MLLHFQSVQELMVGMLEFDYVFKTIVSIQCNYSKTELKPRNVWRSLSYLVGYRSALFQKDMITLS